MFATSIIVSFRVADRLWHGLCAFLIRKKSSSSSSEFKFKVRNSIPAQNTMAGPKKTKSLAEQLDELDKPAKGKIMSSRLRFKILTIL